jgi:biotin transport system substrate-specific component
MTSTASATFVDVLAFRAESAALGRAIRIASVLFVAALTAAAAQISVPLPFTEVPFTFQPMVVLIGGLALGSRLGLASQVLYLAAGIAGLPVFAASPALPPGMLRLLGPTGGYLMSYPIAAFAVGYLAERGFDRRYATAVLAMLIGLAIIYTSGVLWLGLFARTAAPIPIGIRRALMTGVVPFVVPDVLKLLAAAAVLPGIWNLIEPETRRRRSRF